VKILDEVKFGLLAHDIPLGGHHREEGFDINLEFLFASPDIFRLIWSPRPHVGADINVYGKTSSYYAGLTWGGIFYEPHVFVGDGIFAYLSLGGSVNDGKISTTDPTRKSLGSHVLFREGLDLGYQLSPRLSLAAFIDHISNANLANRNEGLTNAGMRVGFKF
jgi:lipid A 3-O-deacylase